MTVQRKPQRRTLVKALREIVQRVDDLNAFGGLDDEKSFRPLLRAAREASTVLKREDATQGAKSAEGGNNPND